MEFFQIVDPNTLEESSTVAVVVELIVACSVSVAIAIAARVIPKYIAHKMYAPAVKKPAKKSSPAPTKPATSTVAPSTNSTTATATAKDEPTPSKPEAPKAATEPPVTKKVGSATVDAASSSEDIDDLLDAALDDHHANEDLLDEVFDEHETAAVKNTVTKDDAVQPTATKKEAAASNDEVDGFEAMMRGKLKAKKEKEASASAAAPAPAKPTAPQVAPKPVAPKNEEEVLDGVLDDLLDDEDMLDDCLAEIAVKPAGDAKPEVKKAEPSSVPAAVPAKPAGPTTPTIKEVRSIIGDNFAPAIEAVSTSEALIRDDDEEVRNKQRIVLPQLEEDDFRASLVDPSKSEPITSSALFESEVMMVEMDLHKSPTKAATAAFGIYCRLGLDSAAELPGREQKRLEILGLLAQAYAENGEVYRGKHLAEVILSKDASIRPAHKALEAHSMHLLAGKVMDDHNIVD